MASKEKQEEDDLEKDSTELADESEDTSPEDEEKATPAEDSKDDDASDEEDSTEFGDPKLLSQEDYDKKIHAPDEYGHVADRKPASDEDKEEVPPPEDEEDRAARENSQDMGAPVQAAPSQKPQSSLDRYQQFIDQYKKLQDQRRNTDLASGLAAASGKIGQSIAGKYSGHFTPDPTGPKLIKEMGERPVQDFEQNQLVQGRQLALKGSMDASDPTSPQSQMVRNYVNQRLEMNLPDTVSAADAQLLLKTVGRPTQTKYQKVNGTWTNPETGTSERMSAVFDPSTGTYKNADTGKPLPGFLAEGLNPFQTTINPNTGEPEIFNKSRGTAPTPAGPSKAPALAAAETPNEVYATVSPEVRKELNSKIAPEFNKATEKTRQRLTHVPVIMQRLQDAQTNPAALPQLKAELARFDVGDQRLAQQEFNMFGQRMGYEGVMDWLNAHTKGTISKDFADSMAKAIGAVSEDLKGEMNDQAEERASQLIARFPEEAKNVDAGKIAPLIYGGYKPKVEKVKVRNLETGQEGMIPKANLKKAIASKKYQEIP